MLLGQYVSREIMGANMSWGIGLRRIFKYVSSVFQDCFKTVSRVLKVVSGVSYIYIFLICFICFSKMLSQPQLNLNLTSTSTVVVGFWQRWQCIPPHHTTQSQRQNSRTPDKHLLTTSKDNMIRNNNWNHNNNITNNNINNNIQTIITSCGWAIELGLRTLSYWARSKNIFV